MPQTPLSHFRRNPFMRFGYGAFANYRLASVTRGVANADGTRGSSAPLSGESQLDVTHTLPAADGDPVLVGRGTWPAPAAGGMSSIRAEGGIAVSYTAAVNGIGPGVYSRTDPSVAANSTVDIDLDNGDSVVDSGAFGGTVDHRYTDPGTYTPLLTITDQLGRVSTQPVATGDITVTADAVAPSFTAGPTAADGGSQTIDTTFTVDDNATVFVVVVLNGAGAPTAQEVKNGQASGGGAPEASGNIAVDATVGSGISGLTPTSGAATYDVYFVANDGTNDQAGAPTAVTGVIVA